MRITEGRYVQNKKLVVAVYIVLRLLVLVTMAFQLVRGDLQNVFICLLTLVLFMLPSFFERRLHIDLPDVLEIVILLFIFCSQILGEIQELYILIPQWDTILHTINGFLFAAIGFSIINIFNENKRTALSMSPMYMAIAAFCFSMTIGVLWEFFEWGMDSVFSLDMQKDTVLQTVSSVTLHPQGRNEPVVVQGIQDVIVVLSDGSQRTLGLGGYLDIGLQDTMYDLLVNLMGAVVFSIFGFFYVKTRGKGKLARWFIPVIRERKKRNDGQMQ
jgi:hypothetical protein